MWIGIAVLLLVLWVVFKFAIGMVSFLIHILIVLAVIALIWHFVVAAKNRL
jgi:hypothetical protein